MTYSALDDLARISLKTGAVEIVVGLQGRIFGVLRAVTSGAIETTMSGADLIEALARGRLVRIGGKGIVGCLSPRAGRQVKSAALSSAAGMAHLARRQIDPPLALSGANLAQVAVTIKASHLVHCAALAFGLNARVAQIARSGWTGRIVEIQAGCRIEY